MIHLSSHACLSQGHWIRIIELWLLMEIMLQWWNSAFVKMTWSILDVMSIETYELLETEPNFSLETWGRSQNWCSYALKGEYQFKSSLIWFKSKWDTNILLFPRYAGHGAKSIDKVKVIVFERWYSNKVIEGYVQEGSDFCFILHHTYEVTLRRQVTVQSLKGYHYTSVFFQCYQCQRFIYLFSIFGNF